MMKWLRYKLVDWLKRGEPDVVIASARSGEYLNRWHVIPRNKWFNIYFHEFVGSDDDRALHDHPWNSLSWVLKGQALEFVQVSNNLQSLELVMEGDFVRRRAEHMHRLELINNEHMYTLFITSRKIREWGFNCPGKGWVHWEEFCAPDGKGDIVGCGE